MLDRLIALITNINRLTKRSALMLTLSVLVVFAVTIVLVSPAKTLDNSEAEHQGGIDVPAAEHAVEMQEISEDAQEAEPEQAEHEGAVEETDQANEQPPDEPASDEPDSGTLTCDNKDYSVSLDYSKGSGITQDTTLSVKEIPAEDGAKSAYREYQKKALKALEETIGETPFILQARYFDITLQDGSTQMEPADPVDVSIDFDRSISKSEKGEFYVVHFTENEKTGKLEASVLGDRDSGFDVKKNKLRSAKFTAESFSVYGLVETTMEKTVLASDGHNYKVSVTFGPETGIPADAELSVKELAADSDAYEAYAAKAERKLRIGEENEEYMRLFDIKIVDSENPDKKYQPSYGTSVDVTIELADSECEKLSVVHFADAEDRGEIVDAETDEGIVNFATDGFSVYAVVDGSTDENARMTLEFYSKGEKVATIYVKNGDTAEELEYIIYDPGAGALSSGEAFIGWIMDKQTYTTEDLANAKDIDQIRAWAQNLTITEGDTHRFDAAICRFYTVTYKDDDGTVLGMDSVPVKADEYGTAAAEDTVKMAYTPKDDVHNFEGWTLEEDSVSNVTSEVPADRNYKNDDTITIKGDVSFEVNAPEGNWLIFDENGKGGKYNAPQFVKSGQNTVVPCADSAMTRNGYTFGGWYDTKEHADAHGQDTSVTTGKFEFGGTIDTKTTVYASWIPNETAPYTVIFWTQNQDRTGYDLKESTVETGPVGQNIPYTLRDNKDEDYFRIGGKDYHYTGFCGKQPETEVVIRPEGDSVLNVYYDRIEYDLRFYLYRYRNQSGSNNDYEYARNAVVGNNVWGVVDFHNRTTLANMPTVDAPLTIQSSTVDGYTSYYFTLHAYYGQDISEMWPKYSQIHCPANDLEAVSYVMMVGTKLKPNPSSSGDGTVKGLITRMDENILGATNDSEGNFLIVRFNAYNNWTYHLYYEAYEGQDLTGKITKTLNGKTYYHVHAENDVTSRSSNTQPYNQNPPQFQGFESVLFSSGQYAGRAYYDGVDSSIPVGSGGIYTGYDPTLNYYYDRLEYPIHYMDGTYFDGDGIPIQNRQEELLHTSDDIPYESAIPESDKQYVPKLPATEEGFVFEGWYADAACNTPYDFTTMPMGGVIVYAKWRQIEYRVFLHPNAGTDPALDWGSETVSTSFRVPYGETISTPNGKRPGSGYEFVGWYTDPSFSSESLYVSDTVLNDETVTTPYDKTENTELDKWGNVEAGKEGINNDAVKNRTWITRKLDLYAKWRKILEGSEGIRVPYTADDGKGHIGTNPPEDEILYPDQADATAQAADMAPEGYHFKHWVIQKWDETQGAYVDTELTVLPGQQFTVTEEYAHKQPVEGETDKYSYTMQLRAEYTEPGSDIPTHIWWFANYSDSDAERHESFHQDEGIQINEAKTIQPAQTRDGYRFLGWARVQTTQSESTSGTPPTGKVLSGLGAEDVYLKYENGQFKLNDPTSEHDGEVVTEVAADERLAYHDMYAVWEPIKFTVTVKKIVEGEEPEGKAFGFTTTGLGEISQDAGSFTLMHNGTKEITEVPYGTKFTLTETPYENYMVKNVQALQISDSDGNPLAKEDYIDLEGQDGKRYEVQGDIMITYTNTPDAVPVKVLKVDQEGNALAGATFTGDRITGSVTTQVVDGEAVIIDEEALPVGTYTLTETAVPAGYNMPEGNIEIAVTSTPTGINVTGKIGTKDIEQKWIEHKDGVWTVKIMNEAGVALPSTGGIGTTILYVIGAMLMIASAAGMMIRRRRA